MKKLKQFLIDVLCGAAMGLAFIVPGISGGALAVIFKFYDKIINAISNIFKKFKESVLYLLPIALGVIICVAALIIPLNLAMEYILFVIICLFAGFIVGSMPGLFDSVKTSKFKPIYILIFIIPFIISVGLGVLSVVCKFDFNEPFIEFPIWLYFVMIPIGFILSLTVVIPGVSGSAFLITIGFYNPIVGLLDEIMHLDFTHIGQTIGIVACAGIGFIIGVFSVAKMMSYLLKKYAIGTMYGIIGFVAGSIIALFINNDVWAYYPNLVNRQWEIYVGVLVFILAIVGSYMLVRLGRKKENEVQTIEEQKE